MELAEKVEAAIRRARLLEPGTRVAVACSGGADSVALLRVLLALQDSLGVRLLVVHLNHQLRGAESDTDEGFVRRLAQRLGLEFLVRREDVAVRANKYGLNLEEAGRQARLEFFTHLIAANKADAVALAHTLDDQAETLLARITRGAGTRGLAGIYPVVELGGAAGHGRIVRPLLGVRRAELRDYLSQLEQDWREDTTNLDPRRLRNRIRLELLPKLDPAAIQHLGRLAEQARQEEGFWGALIEERFQALVAPRGDRFELEVAALLAPAQELARLSPRAAREAQRAVAQRLVRRTLEAVRGDLRRITQAHVESVLRLAEEGQSGQRVELPGAVVERCFSRLVFGSPQPRTATEAESDYGVQVEGPGSVTLPSGDVLSFKLVAVGELESGYNDGKKAADAARAPFPLRVRAWQPGDSYRPAGANRRKKLKTLFQQARIPVGERLRRPVVLCGEEIVWASGLGFAAGYELVVGSRRALLIEERVGA
jgi:tRNA(Ile)-lysidine synthase